MKTLKRIVHVLVVFLGGIIVVALELLPSVLFALYFGLVLLLWTGARLLLSVLGLAPVGIKVTLRHQPQDEAGS